MNLKNIMISKISQAQNAKNYDDLNHAHVDSKITWAQTHREQIDSDFGVGTRLKLGEVMPKKNMKLHKKEEFLDTHCTNTVERVRWMY